MNFDDNLLNNINFQNFDFEKDVIYDPRHGPLNNPISRMDGYSKISEKAISSSSMDSYFNRSTKCTPNSLLPSNFNCLRTDDNLDNIEFEDIQPDVIFPDSSTLVSESSFSNVSTKIDLTNVQKITQKDILCVSIGEDHQDKQGSVQQEANDKKIFVPITISNQIEKIHITEIDLTSDSLPKSEITQIDDISDNEIIYSDEDISDEEIAKPVIHNIQRKPFHTIKVEKHNNSFTRLPPAMQSLGSNNQISSNLSISKSNTKNKNSSASLTNELNINKSPPSTGKFRLRPQNSLLKHDNQVNHILDVPNKKFRTRFHHLKTILAAIVASEKRYFNLGLHKGPLPPGIKEKLLQLGAEAARLARTTAVFNNSYTKYPTFFDGKKV